VHADTVGAARRRVATAIHRHPEPPMALTSAMLTDLMIAAAWLGVLLLVG